MAKISKFGLIATKIGMTSIPTEEGNFIAVTLLKVEDQKITKILDLERDGYCGFQVGYKKKSETRLTKADITRLRKVQIEDNYAKFCEFRTTDKPEASVGDQLTVELLKDVTAVDVTGFTKGRGFQGAVKRWGSAIGRKSHGSRFHRRPGSLGSNTSPGRVFKNKHQPGQMGVEQRTARNLSVVDVDVARNVIAVKGSIPGNRKSYIEIRETNKAQRN